LRSRTPSMNAEAASISMCSTGSPTKARLANFSIAAAKSCSVSPLAWVLALSCDRQAADGWRSRNSLSEPQRCFRK
jgi:hypothetical protein